MAQPKHGDVVLIDTNVIIESVRLNIWNALQNTFQLHTVEEVIKEAIKEPAGKAGLPLTEGALRSGFANIADITSVELAQMAIDKPELADYALDKGEQHLVCYLTQLKTQDCWMLCGPDKGTINAMHALGVLEHLVPLEALGNTAGVGKKDYKDNYTKKWHETARMNKLLGIN